MDQKSLAFWKNHSANFIEMALRTDKRENLHQADGYGRCTRECGDTLEIFLILRDGRIRSASFQTHGCIYTVACANALMDLVEGKTAEEAWKISEEDVRDFLETLPKNEEHCAELAIKTLRLALVDLRRTERQPWRKLYPRK